MSPSSLSFTCDPREVTYELPLTSSASYPHLKGSREWQGLVMKDTVQGFQLTFSLQLEGAATASTDRHKVTLRLQKILDDSVGFPGNLVKVVLFPLRWLK
ncbi:hypothetical protein E2C01_096271 [Portunus trituberculatus]|uniref:Uncharacterized protein n=1 Tax=Portunus trituberculatus TaxID=210409 RepID=A0A5B7JXI9_PORTR|nr:hypothetical protein [Portunus trituberculatus]